MPDKKDDSRSQMSVWIPKEIHKQVKMLAIERDLDLRDVVAQALHAYLSFSGFPQVGGVGASSNRKAGSISPKRSTRKRGIDNEQRIESGSSGSD